MVNELDFRSSWICRTAFERARFLDIHRRLMPLNTKLLVLVLLVIAPAGRTLEHLWSVIPVLLTVAGFAVLQRRAGSFTRPELWVFFALLGTETGIAAAVTINGSEHTGALAMLLWPACGASGRFRTLAAAIATGFAAGLMTVSELATNWGLVWQDSMRLTLPLFALVATTAIVTALRHSDVEHRGAAVLDPLTGMLNRSALHRRTQEIEAQSLVTGQPVGLIVADIDAFKLVNDEHGHATGDSVLREVAYVLRRELRAYDLAYRLGGEEFAVVLLGADLEATTARAEQLRAAVATEPMSGLSVTLSLGVSATDPGEPFVWEDAFVAADMALYEAKAGGRDRVVTADRAAAGLVA